MTPMARLRMLTEYSYDFPFLDYPRLPAVIKYKQVIISLQGRVLLTNFFS